MNVINQMKVDVSVICSIYGYAKVPKCYIVKVVKVKLFTCYDDTV